MGQDTVWAGILWRNTMKNQPGTMKNHGNQPKTMKNHETTLNCICFVSFKLFFYQIYYVLSNHNNFGRGRGGRAGISKNVTHLHGVTTDQGRGGRAGISKNVTHLHGVTTDLLDV